MKNRFVVFSCLCFLSLLLLAACGAPGPGESAFATSTYFWDSLVICSG